MFACFRWVFSSKSISDIIKRNINPKLQEIKPAILGAMQFLWLIKCHNVHDWKRTVYPSRILYQKCVCKAGLITVDARSRVLFTESVEVVAFTVGEKTPCIKYANVYEYADGGKKAVTFSSVLQVCQHHKYAGGGNKAVTFCSVLQGCQSQQWKYDSLTLYFSGV